MASFHSQVRRHMIMPFPVLQILVELLYSNRVHERCQAFNGERAKVSWLLHADSEDSEQTVDAQADLNLCWAHLSFNWFCPAFVSNFVICVQYLAFYADQYICHS